MASLEKKVKTNLLEKLADLEHRHWSHWTRYFLEFDNPQNRERWKRQAHAPYNKLTEKEKESDREWARKVLAVFNKELAKVAQQIREQIQFSEARLKTLDKRKGKQEAAAMWEKGYILAKEQDLGLLVEEEGEKKR